VEPALLVGSDSDIMAVNAAFLSLFDMTAVPKSREDLLRSFTLRLPDGSPVPNHRTPYGRALRGETVRDYELTARKERTGQVLHLLTGAAAVHDGDGAVRAVVVTFHDITERKRSEQKLARSNEVLRQFAYAAAHDLQEPLRNVGLSSEMLMRKFGQQFGDGGKQLLANNIDGARRMQRMVRDLLDYAMVIDVSTSVPPVCSADAVMRDVAGNLREAVAEAGADVQFEGLPAVRIERTHLLQLFQNLVRNSLKYRRHDVPPLIRVAAERRLGEVVFCVADNGIGFDPVHAQRIFGLFRRLHGQKDYPGTGIGLALCERIVEHYGGRIWAESMPGSGSRFYFALPDQRS
jgi:light-regulated signal transduction histidine kinase (bacteriophytochrome)